MSLDVIHRVSRAIPRDLMVAAIPGCKRGGRRWEWGKGKRERGEEERKGEEKRKGMRGTRGEKGKKGGKGREEGEDLPVSHSPR